MGLYPDHSYSLKSILSIEYSDTTIYEILKLEENRSYSFPLSRHIEQDTIISLSGFVNLSGKLPLIPIQLHQISLGDSYSNGSNDSTILVADKEKELSLVKPKMMAE